MYQIQWENSQPNDGGHLVVEVEVEVEIGLACGSYIGDTKMTMYATPGTTLKRLY